MPSFVAMNQRTGTLTPGGSRDGAVEGLSMDSGGRIDVSKAADRRRFILQRALRKNTRGSGSDLAFLLTLPQSESPAIRTSLFAPVPAMLAGGHAANAYAPERTTSDTDFLVPHDSFPAAEQRLRDAGCEKRRDLFFPNAALGLYGSAWSTKEAGAIVDLMSSTQAWLSEAFSAPATLDRSDERVLPLPYLVLMKVDSARSIDHGDLGRILGRLSNEDLEDVIAIVERYYGDPAAPDDLRQYHKIGHWEYDVE
jgi:hypothetical protein